MFIPFPKKDCSMKNIAFLFLALMLAARPSIAAPAEDAFAAPRQQAQAAYDAGDYVRAFMLIRPLAERGDAKSQSRLAYLYNKGIGVTQNKAKAFAWYGKAAQQGDPVAQLNLGLMYARGEGTNADRKSALRWLKKAEGQTQNAEVRAKAKQAILLVSAISGLK